MRAFHQNCVLTKIECMLYQIAVYPPWSAVSAAVDRVVRAEEPVELLRRPNLREAVSRLRKHAKENNKKSCHRSLHFRTILISCRPAGIFNATVPAALSNLKVRAAISLPSTNTRTGFMPENKTILVPVFGLNTASILSDPKLAAIFAGASAENISWFPFTTEREFCEARVFTLEP